MPGRRRNLSHMAAAGMLALVSLLVAVPADAGVYEHSDPSGDMWRGSDPESWPSETWAATPHHHVGDIRAVRVTHAARIVRIRVKFTELKRVGQYLGVIGRIRTRPPGRSPYRVDFEYAAGPWWSGASSHPWRGRGELDGARAGISGTINYVRDLIIVRIDRSAVASPRWVRVALQSGHWTEAAGWQDWPFVSAHQGVAGSYSPRLEPQTAR